MAYKKGEGSSRGQGSTPPIKNTQYRLARSFRPFLSPLPFWVINDPNGKETAFRMTAHVVFNFQGFTKLKIRTLCQRELSS